MTVVAPREDRAGSPVEQGMLNALTGKDFGGTVECVALADAPKIEANPCVVERDQSEMCVDPYPRESRPVVRRMANRRVKVAAGRFPGHMAQLKDFEKVDVHAHGAMRRFTIHTRGFTTRIVTGEKTLDAIDLVEKRRGDRIEMFEIVAAQDHLEPGTHRGVCLTQGRGHEGSRIAANLKDPREWVAIGGLHSHPNRLRGNRVNGQSVDSLVVA